MTGRTLLLSFLPLSVLLAVSCEDTDDGSDASEEETTTVTLTLADPDATAETKALYSNLWAIQEDGWMFGHHDDLMYGRYWYNVQGKSDTYDVCGDYPAVLGVDVAEMVDDRVTDEDSIESSEIKRRCMVEAYDMGMVILACAHFDNPLTGEDAWDNSSDEVVAQILTEGSETNLVFLSWLDNLADLANNLYGSDGKLIPIIFRPFHEHTEDWSWWGESCTTLSEYVSLWQYTVSYLRDTKGVHTFIYAIAPQMDSAKEEDDFFFRWPGDEWVDFMGMDCYQGINNSVFVSNLKVLSKISRENLMPCGVTETGVEGFSAEDYWITNIAAPMASRFVSMLVTWRNKYDPEGSGTHYYSVFLGHVSEESFIEMYERDDTFFRADLPDMYSLAENVIVE